MLEVAVLGRGKQAPVRAAVAVDAGVVLDVVAGEVLAARARRRSPTRVAVGKLHVALVGDHAAPDLALVAERVAGRVAQPGVGELAVFDRIAGRR